MQNEIKLSKTENRIYQKLEEISELRDKLRNLEQN
jgi:hypothetical protein